MLGNGSSEMTILAIGIVKDIDLDEWRVYVDWVVPNINNRIVPLKNCMASIHGPFIKESEYELWINQIFSL